VWWWDRGGKVILPEGSKAERKLRKCGLWRNCICVLSLAQSAL